MKSLTKMLWVLWGLGWVLVPVTAKHFRVEHVVPIVMFGWLAALLIATWHKGALLRAALRSLAPGVAAPPDTASSGGAAEPVRKRVALTSSPPPEHQVRVHTGHPDVTAADALGDTEIRDDHAQRTAGG